MRSTAGLDSDVPPLLGRYVIFMPLKNTQIQPLFLYSMRVCWAPTMRLALGIIHQRTKKIADLILEREERHPRAKPKCKPHIIRWKLLAGVNDFCPCKCWGGGGRRVPTPEITAACSELGWERPEHSGGTQQPTYSPETGHEKWWVLDLFWR